MNYKIVVKFAAHEHRTYHCEHRYEMTQLTGILAKATKVEEYEVFNQDGQQLDHYVNVIELDDRSNSTNLKHNLTAY